MSQPRSPQFSSTRSIVCSSRFHTWWRQPFSKRAMLWQAFLVCSLGIVLLWSVQPHLRAESDSQSQPTAFTCSTITDVPQSECQALAALYAATNGSGWLNKTNWLSEQQTQICDVWHGIICTNNRVTTISLGQNQLAGALPAQLVNLTQLQVLWLDRNQLSGSIPSELGSMTQMREIVLWSNQLTGAIPATLGDLSNLTWLDLSRNQLSGALPVSLTRLSNLRTLGAQENQLTGSLPTGLGSLTQLENLWLGGNQFSGAIPAELGNLTKLKDLGLWDNQLSGGIPPQLGNLQQLTSLWLSGNQLTGAIPQQLSQLTNLQDLLLSANQLSGNIPASLGSLTNLSESLGLNNNQFTGPIPAELGNLTKLKRLSLRDNQLSGTLPGSLGNMAQLTLLYVHNNPGLTGPLPAALVNLTQMADLQFQNTNLCEPATAAMQTWLAGIATLQKSGIHCDTGVTPQPTSGTAQPTATRSTPTPTTTPTQTPTATPTDDGCDKFDDLLYIPVADATVDIVVHGASVEVTLNWTQSPEGNHIFAVLNTYLIADGDVVIPPGEYIKNKPTILRVSDLPDGTYHVIVVYNEIPELAQLNQSRAVHERNLQPTPTPSLVNLSAPAGRHTFAPMADPPPFHGTYHFKKPDCIEKGERTGNSDSFWNAYKFTVGAKPEIKGIDAKHPLNGYRYLRSVTTNNEITVDVDWQGRTPGMLELTETGSGARLASAAAGEKIVLDMGALPQEGLNTLQVIAYTAQSKIASEPYEEQVYSMALPAWITGLASGETLTLPDFIGQGIGSEDKYQLSVILPPTKLKLDIPDFIVPKGQNEFKWEVSGKAVIPTICSGKLSAEIAGRVQYTFIVSKIEGSATGKGESKLDKECEFGPPTFTTNAQVKGTYTFLRRPILLLIPYANPALGTAVYIIFDQAGIANYVGKLGEFYLDGTLAVDTELNASVILESPYLKIDKWTVGGAVGIQSGFRTNLKIAEFDAWLGAGGKITYLGTNLLNWELPDLRQFDKVAIYGEMGVKLRIINFVAQRTGRITWEYPKTGLLTLADLTENQPDGWQIIRHDTGPQAARLVLAPDAANGFQAATTASDGHASLMLTPQTSILVRNVYTYPETTLALNPVNGQAAMLWVQTDASKAVGQAHELLASHWNGTAWSQPSAVTNDPLLDFDPSAAWAEDGNLVAVWQRFPTAIDETATLTDSLMQQSEIATASYNPTTNRWSSPSLLTNNSALDMAPVVARNRAGKLLAAWRQNAARRLDGNITRPDQVITAFYDRGWRPTATAIPEVPGLIDLAVGYGDNTALLVFSRFITPTNNLTPTLELFASQWNGSTWSPPQPITSDSPVDQHDPQIVYNQANQPIVVWLSDSELRLRNLTTAVTSPPLLLPSTIGELNDFALVPDAGGNLAAVFTAINHPHSLYLVFYDQVHQLWSNPTPLAADSAIARDLSAAMDAAGRLLLGYAVTERAYVTKTLTLDDGSIISYTLPEDRQTSLMTLSRSFARNLTLSQADLATTTVGEQTTITATIHNRGDFALSQVKIRFYVEQNGVRTLINDQTLPTPLAGHSSATVTSSYSGSLPATAFAAEVDPENRINESDETDNSTFVKQSNLYLPVVFR